MIAFYQVEYTIYSDGSGSGGTRKGGAVAVVTRAPPIHPEVVTTIKTKGSMFTSSYEEEATALESALSWTWKSTNYNHPSITILSCTDSKSLCKAITSSNPHTSSIQSSVNAILSSISIQWIPSHSVIRGNELADKAAKESTTFATNTILPVSFSSSIPAINETIRDDPLTPERVALIYQHQKASRDSKQVKNQNDNVLLARLRSGHHPFLHQYLYRLDSSQDPIGPKYRLDEQDLNHCLCECSADDAIISKCLGTTILLTLS